MFIWTISDAIGVFLFVTFIIVFLLVWLHQSIQQWRCQHDGDVTETISCEAICRKCGKNLGFIGKRRKS